MWGRHDREAWKHGCLAGQPNPIHPNPVQRHLASTVWRYVDLAYAPGMQRQQQMKRRLLQAALLWDSPDCWLDGRLGLQGHLPLCRRVNGFQVTDWIVAGRPSFIHTLRANPPHQAPPALVAQALETFPAGHFACATRMV